MNFDSLGLTQSLLKAVADSGYTTATPIQQQAIPAILDRRDVMAAAQTGTGKTAGFTLPMLQNLEGGNKPGRTQVRALVLAPTRELAAQVQDDIRVYGKYSPLRSLAVFGGVNINPQIKGLQNGVDILVATPGRLLDLYQQKAVRFDALELLVLDEADRMLDMGFIHDIRRILKLLPAQRQNLMFSATFSDEIRTLARTICRQPLEIDVAPRNSTVERITQQVYPVSKENKLPLLGKLLGETADQVLVFSRTKHGANALVKKLGRYKVQAAAIHGNKSQAARTKALADFKNNRIQVLVATDIAARGIDIDQLAMVINYDLPQVPEDYVHRIGRTGRAGAAGLAVSLVTREENSQLKAIERLIKLNIPKLPVGDLPEPLELDIEVEAPARPQQANRRQGRQGQNGQNARNGQARGGQARNGQTRNGQTRNGQEERGDRPASDGRSRSRRGGQGRAAPQARADAGTRSESGNRDNSDRKPRRRRSGKPRQEQQAKTDKPKQGVWASLRSMLSTA